MELENEKKEAMLGIQKEQRFLMERVSKLQVYKYYPFNVPLIPGEKVNFYINILKHGSATSFRNGLLIGIRPNKDNIPDFLVYVYPYRDEYLYSVSEPQKTGKYPEQLLSDISKYGYTEKDVAYLYDLPFDLAKE